MALGRRRHARDVWSSQDRAVHARDARVRRVPHARLRVDAVGDGHRRRRAPRAGRTRSAGRAPKGVAWVMPVAIFGMLFFTGMSLARRRSRRADHGPYVFAWSALFLALGWNFLDYGFDPPGGGTVGELAGVRLRVRRDGRHPAARPVLEDRGRWALWGPVEEPLRTRARRAPRCDRPRPHRLPARARVAGSRRPPPSPTSRLRPPDARTEAGARGRRGRPPRTAGRPAREAADRRARSTNRRRRKILRDEVGS